MENETILPETNPEIKKSKFPIGTILLVIGVFVLGYFAGGGKIVFSSGKINITKGDVPSGAADYSLLWDALETLNNKYVDRPLDQQKLLYGAVAGLVEATGDPYTSFFDPKEAKTFAEELRGSFDGIGAEIGIKNEQLVIIAPLEDSPAQKAGILAGDIIIEIDGESTQEMSVDTAVSKIRGKAGTQVKLNILHPEKTSAQEITITRAKIEIKSLKMETKEVNGKKIAILKVSRFGDDTEDFLNQAVDQIVTGGYQGIVLDLRNNPGGYLDTAVTTISNWVDSGQVVLKERGFGGAEKSYDSKGIPRLKGIKTVVLVNGGSASASEIVAGALQDYGIATIVGEKTFGKGSVQELIQLKDNTQVKVTIAKWFTPKDRGIDKTGLEPDTQIELTPEDMQNKKDPQMDKALELMK